MYVIPVSMATWIGHPEAIPGVPAPQGHDHIRGLGAWRGGDGGEDQLAYGRVPGMRRGILL